MVISLCHWPWNADRRFSEQVNGMMWFCYRSGLVFLDSSLYSVPSRVQRTFSLDSFTYMNASVSALINLRVTPSCVSLVHQHTSRMQHPSERMINEMEASSASLGSPFRPILTPPSAHWHLRDSTSNERQQPTSEIILRPGTVCAEWHWLSHTFTQTHTHTPASERRWRKKWEVLGGCESQVRECVYRCLKMRAPGVLIGRGRWVRDVRLVVCYVSGRMAGEKEGSVKNRECENDTDGLQRRRWRGGEKKKAFWIGERSWARGLLEWLNIKTEQLINQSSKVLFPLLTVELFFELYIYISVGFWQRNDCNLEDWQRNL